MCGICGIAYRDVNRPVDREQLVAMRDTIAHRGPDGAGLHCDGPVGLGHRRLSIIDIHGGAQPLSNEDQTIWVSFNGEIYNYQELTRELEQRGHRFATNCDTEVLVHAYEEYGLDFASRLNGMFALALHDSKRQRVILARDHVGIKPLFYSVTADGLLFASEIKAILAVLGHTPRVDRRALQEYLTFRYVAWDGSFFEGINRLPQGHIAVWEHGALEQRQFWSVADGRGVTEIDDDVAVEKLDGLLEQAVRSQLMSDVPLGTFCSGGIDSGLVTGFAARHKPGDLHTFSVGFDNPDWDETPLALDTATRFGTEHHSIASRSDSFKSLLSDLIWHNDEPLSHPNSVPLYVLSGLAREFVTVVLTGEGADELFGGYPRYHLARLAVHTQRLPAWLTSGAAKAVRYLPGHRARLVSMLLPGSAEDSMLFNSAYVHPGVVDALTGLDCRDAVSSRRALLRGSVVQGDPIASISRYELQTYLGCALERMDRMSMAHGLEGRVPILDTPLVEWGVALPSRLKLKGKRNKVALKQLAERMLSRQVVHGPKSGFGLPLGNWFREPALGSLMNRLRDPNHPAAPLFQGEVLSRMLDEHSSGKHDHGQAIWLLLNVYLWHEVHGVG